MRPLLALVAILKNEAPTVARTLASVRGVVDEWCVFDTGSTDGTQAIVREAMQGLPGLLFEGEFGDYAQARNRVLDVATDPAVRGSGESAVFTLMLSADEVLEGGAELRKFLEAKRDAADGAYAVEMQSSTQRWFYPRILRTDAHWRYVGAIHEVPVGPNKETTGPLAPGVRVVHTMSDPERRGRRVREVDFPILTKMVEDESKSLDERAQAIFFLGQTHEALASECSREPGGPRLSHQMAAMALYRRYASIAENKARLNFDPVKAGFARMRYLNIAEDAKFFSNVELLVRLDALSRLYPQIPEIRYMIARNASQVEGQLPRALVLAEEAARVAREAKEQPLHVPTDDRLEWLSLRVAAECARVLGKKDKARLLAEKGIAVGGPKEAFADYLMVEH